MVFGEEETFLPLMTTPLTYGTISLLTPWFVALKLTRKFTKEISDVFFESTKEVFIISMFK